MLSTDTLMALSTALQSAGYSVRSGAGSDCYYITSRQVGLFETECYCLIADAGHWRLNVVSAADHRERIASLIAPVLGVEVQHG